ncbi:MULTISPECIES: type II toxin-antitoxin system VapC family toxin [unclassified Commensalibacter]|uniref:type II toxin-antitoxin system tRNA(fMet)-specific endonuclease VapC n=1 Tax=unclassified Commensalibacter TaxID=2630218 RepID=UPI0018DBC21C|nr:type II toxin-antitoxin system VapC family toxin [Commensalibacter sp. M0265]MBH9978030.1 type II toxin-antitoxin system VapC family toxin [Commensalibacter sp. M0266]MBI0047206.1 type II toxin-antitoxin system VapC family toxin [Commensalibacter sp. M0267]MBI0056875.1 type II toxin-antitoxin system VapC family toxin [Commensalibacter sp. M0268]
MIYLLDTNICIYIINNKPPHVFEKFKQFQLGQLGISSITASELAFGIEKSGSQRNKQALNKFLAPLEILPYDEQSIWRYAQLRHQLQSTGQPIGSLDMLIAAHALALDVTLVTNNVKEFKRVKGLIVENWV